MALVSQLRKVSVLNLARKGNLLLFQSPTRIKVNYFYSLSNSSNFTSASHFGINPQFKTAVPFNSKRSFSTSFISTSSLISAPSLIVSNFLSWIQSTTNLPWVFCIGTLALGIRLAVFPVTVKAQKHAAAMTKIQPELRDLNEQFKAANSISDMQKSTEIISQINQLYSINKTSPWRQIICTLFPAPMFIMAFVGLKEMANTKLPSSLTSGGCLWFQDLTVPDPYFILPLLSCVSILFSMEIAQRMKGSSFIPSSSKQKYALRMLAFVGFPFIMNLPANLTCYFVFGNLFNCLQSWVLGRGAVRNLFGLNTSLGQSPTLESFYEGTVKFRPEKPPMPYGFEKKGILASFKEKAEKVRIETIKKNEMKKKAMQIQ